MIVEMVGPPGSGKTTLLPTVIEVFQDMEIQVFTVVDAARAYAQRTLPGRIVMRLPSVPLQNKLLWQIFSRLSILNRIKFVAKHPTLIRGVRKAQSRRPPEADVRQRKVLYWFYRLTGYYEFLNRYMQAGEAVIFDEGFFHRVVQLFSSSVESPQEQQICWYIDLLPPPDLTVFVQAPPSVCEERIYQRGLWPRLQHRNQDEISQFVVNAYQAVKLAVDRGRANGWSIIEVENGNVDLQYARNALRQSILSNLNGSVPKVSSRML